MYCICLSACFKKMQYRFTVKTHARKFFSKAPAVASVCCLVVSRSRTTCFWVWWSYSSVSFVSIRFTQYPRILIMLLVIGKGVRSATNCLPFFILSKFDFSSRSKYSMKLSFLCSLKSFFKGNANSYMRFKRSQI